MPLEERGSKDSDCVFQLSDGEDAGGEGEGRSEKLDDSMEMAQPRRRPGRLDKVRLSIRQCVLHAVIIHKAIRIVLLCGSAVYFPTFFFHF